LGQRRADSRICMSRCWCLQVGERDLDHRFRGATNLTTSIHWSYKYRTSVRPNYAEHRGVFRIGRASSSSKRQDLLFCHANRCHIVRQFRNDIESSVKTGTALLAARFTRTRHPHRFPILIVLGLKPLQQHSQYHRASHPLTSQNRARTKYSSRISTCLLFLLICSSSSLDIYIPE
jgi:hypothetical protein